MTNQPREATWLLLINGGPCPTCGGNGFVRVMQEHVVTLDDDDDPKQPCPSPDCKDGRRPGVIERLDPVTLLPEPIRSWNGISERRAVIAAVIADLRRMVGES